MQDNYSYLIIDENKNDACVVDPSEAKPIINFVEKENINLKYILNTHHHFDHIGGNIELKEKYDSIVVGYKYDAERIPEINVLVEDNQIWKEDNFEAKIIHIPGHTTGHIAFYFFNEKIIFTGDTLFLGDVGRPDLAQQNMKLTKEELAGKLYDSLRNKIMNLPDDIIIYPAHGAGSACGKNMMNITSDSLANQKKLNYALNKNLSKESFVLAVLNGLEDPPKYFPSNVKMNKEGYEDIDNILAPMIRRVQRLSWS